MASISSLISAAMCCWAVLLKFMQQPLEWCFDQMGWCSSQNDVELEQDLIKRVQET